jgi:hypothetical protein
MLLLLPPGEGWDEGIIYAFDLRLLRTSVPIIYLIGFAHPL